MKNLVFSVGFTDFFRKKQSGKQQKQKPSINFNEYALVVVPQFIS